MKIPALIALLLFNHVVAAQKKMDSLTTGTTFLRCNLLNVADLSEPNISFGIERRIFNNISAALDASYIVYSQRFHSKGRSSGFILRPAIRFFPDNSKIFFEAELHYKQTTHRLHDWVGHDQVNGVAAYEEYQQFRLRKRVYGTHIKMGGLIPVAKRLWFEIYIGLGMRIRKFTIVDHPDYVYQFSYLFDLTTTGRTERLMALPAGWRIVYQLR
jgi:hypothetical protein